MIVVITSFAFLTIYVLQPGLFFLCCQTTKMVNYILIEVSRLCPFKWDFFSDFAW